jgi:cell volume regulation protein A
MDDGELILVAGTLLAGGLVATLVAGRLQVPGLVLFIGIGMAIGSDGTGWIDFDDYDAAQTVGVIALALILFEGGLTAGLSEVRPVLRSAASLALLGTLATAVIAGFAAAWLFDFSTLEGLLVGSIIAATDGAAIFALLRGSTLRRRLARTLEAESGLNDPIAVLLVIGFIDWIKLPDYGLDDMVWLFAQQLSIGASVGYVTGRLATKAFQRLRLASPGLYPVASLAAAAVAFGAADSLQGSGFLSVYIAALMLGSAAIPAKRTITTFHQGMAWLAQIVMFLALGLLVFPSQLDDVAVKGTVLALIVMLVARPASAFLATSFESFAAAERLLLGWAGLRGAVPIVLATFPITENVPRGMEFFNVVFFAVLLSTLLQGATFEWLARRLGLTTSEPALPRPLSDIGTIRRLGAEVLEYPVHPKDAVAGRLVRDLGLPRDALLNVIVRGEEAIPPRGSTRIEPGDRLHVLVRQEVSGEIPELTERWRTGPIGESRRPRLAARANAMIFMTRPWTKDDGDPSHPREILGIPVVEHMRTRRDQPGALVALADGRYAISGPLLAVGGPTLLQRHVRDRLRLADTEQERAWWQEVAGAVTSSGF